MTAHPGVYPSRLRARVLQGVPRGRGLPAEEWARRHRGLLAIVWLHAVAVPLFGLAQGYDVLHAFGESLIVAVAGAVAAAPALGRNVRSAAVSIALLSSSALLVHFSGGFIEVHFHFFVMMGLLSLYQHWMPFLLAIAYVALHHGIGGAIDPEAVYNHPDAIADPWKWAGIHAGFVFAASTANLFAWRYFEQEQQRRQDLLRVTEAALSRLPLTELLDEVLLRVSQVVRADTATISLRGEDCELEIAAAWNGRPGDSGSILPASDVIVSAIAADAAPVTVTDVSGENVANPVHRRVGATSLAGVPLLAGDTLTGILDVGSVERRHFSSSDLTLLELAAERIAPTIDRARLHEQDHRIAEMLQQSLLPKSLPEVAGVSLAFRYQPAGERVEAGGDWYDAFTLPGHRLGLAIGDVVGRGTEAASLMGQLRTALRAYALEGHSPAEIFPRLSRLARELDQENMATLLYMELDPVAGRAAYAAAGHLPPLLASPGSSPEFLWEGRGTPIGSPAHGSWTEAELELEPGSTLILCTDGLIETRVSAIDAGFQRLQDAVATKAALPPDRLCDELVAEVTQGDGGDDVAVMAVRLEASTGDVLELELPAIPESAGVVRRALDRWLREQEVPPAAAQDVVLACSEASANAIEHAYGPGDATFRVSARCADGEVLVDVADRGRWQPPPPGGDGRGLIFIEALMDGVELDRAPEGTTLRMRKVRSGQGSGSGAGAEFAA